MLGGAVVVATGLVLDFPIFGQDRATMSLAHVVHSGAAVLILAASFGHIYMGTIAMEGAFEVMKTGYADANWAKEHHDLWYEEVAGTAEPYPEGRSRFAYRILRRRRGAIERIDDRTTPAAGFPRGLSASGV
ncbi:MAG: hypothetical protein M5U09_09690 [Gammaproteobacteria bacterium]|nr:hypothetical protein [Gammaproteobacteria bacterium]